MDSTVTPDDRDRAVIPLATLVASGVIGVLAVVNLVWLQLHTAPPTWDEANYLETTELLFQGMKSRSVSAFWSAYVGAVFGSKAPLVSFLPLPAFLVLGNTKIALDLTLVALSVCFGWTCYSMSVALTRDRWLAVAAVVITGTIPIVYGLSRVWLVEYGLTVLVMAWVWTLVRSNYYRRLGFSPLLGVLFGLGMLMKISFAGLIFVPAAWAIIVHLRRYGVTAATVLRLTLNWIVILIVGGAVLVTWYLPNENYRATIDHTLQASADENYAAYGLTLAGTAAYTRDLVVEGVSLSLSLLAAVLALFHLGRRVTRRRSHATAGRPREAAILLVAWPAVMFALSCTTLVKDLRYLLPIFPAIGAGIAWLLVSAFPSARLRAWAVPGLLTVPVLVFLFNSLPFSSGFEWRPGQQWVIGNAWGYVRRPVRERWPNEAIIQAIARDAPRYIRESGGKDPFVVAVTDRSFFNQHTFRYQTAHLGLNTRMHWSAMQTGRDQTDARWRRALAWMVQAKYLVIANGEQGPAWVNFRNPEIRAMLESGALPYSPLASFPLPDGSRATLYHKNRKDVSIVDAQAIARPAQVVGWEVRLAEPDTLRLKVWRRTAGQFVVVGQTDRLSGTPGRNVFTLSRPLEVVAGDLVGLYTANGSVRLLEGDEGENALRKQWIFDGDVSRADVASGLLMPQQLDIRLHVDDTTLAAATKPRPSSMYEPNVALMTWVDYSKRVEANGVIAAWVVTAADPSLFRLKIWRPSSDGWTVVAEGPIESGELGINRFVLDTPIAVQAGDYLGFSTVWRSKHPFPVAYTNCGAAKGSAYAHLPSEQGDYRGHLTPNKLVPDPACFQIKVLAGKSNLR